MLPARVYDSGFPLSHDTYNGIAAAGDGRIYYILCSEDPVVGGQMYCCDPAAQTIHHVADLTRSCGESDSVSQGKSHVPFIESDGRLWFATHIGYYDIVDGKEMPGSPPPGRSPYPGGHVLAYHLASGSVEDYGIPIPGEGILTMGMDTSHGLVYGLTWPHGRFFRFDARTRQSTDLGLVFNDGELGIGNNYRTICRSLAVDPRDGSAYLLAERDRFTCAGLAQTQSSSCPAFRCERTTSVPTILPLRDTWLTAGGKWSGTPGSNGSMACTGIQDTCSPSTPLTTT